MLGEGGYSSVFLVEDMDTGHEYAMKRMLLSQEKMGMAQSEIKIMVRKIHHRMHKQVVFNNRHAHQTTESTPAS